MKILILTGTTLGFSKAALKQCHDEVMCQQCSILLFEMPVCRFTYYFLKIVGHTQCSKLVF